MIYARRLGTHRPHLETNCSYGYQVGAHWGKERVVQIQAMSTIHLLTV